MLDRKRYCALVLLLLPIEFAASADAAEWTGAPAQWIDGFDRAAFCKTGEWTFNAFGERLPGHSLLQPSEISAAKVLLKEVGKRAASWIPDGPRADEVTILRIVRNDDGMFTIRAFAGTTLAAWRIYNPRASECRPGVSLRINTDANGAHGEMTSLALASDGSLILRQDKSDDFLWPLLTLSEGSFFARFSAADAKARPPNSAN